MLADRLQRARERGFVGRDAERQLFASALGGRAGDLVTLFLHGPGGVGKSTLLRRLADDAEATGRTVCWVDGQTAGSPTAFAAVAEGAHTPGAVLLVDTFERCQTLEPWLREEFLPGLPADALVVIAGRRPPGPSWRADPSWASALHVLQVDDMGPADAAALLQARGVPPELREPVLAFAGGLPMALSLAAELATRDDGVTASLVPSQDVIQTLLSELVGAVPSADHQRALQVCAHAYRTTEDLLRVALPGSDARALFSWLRGLPFIESGSHGIYPHDVVRGALDTDLRRRDPSGYAELHGRVRGYVFGQLVAPRAQGVGTLRALRHLRRYGGVLPRFVSPEGETDVEEDVLRAEDHSDVRAMAAGTEGEESARIVEFWLHRQPSAFTVYRHLDTAELVAFMAWLRLAELREDEIAADPVVAAAWAHSLAVAPPHPGEYIGLARHMVYPAAYMRPSPIADLQQMRALAAWLGERRMAWSYTVLAYPDFWQPLLDHNGQARLPATPLLDGREFGIFAHDWRREPPERWRNRQVALEPYGTE
ncbi:MAG TPA: ATP-binding protein [Pseudonocardia sp.]|uniref:ATP-binding protein n=1 Tax=Pseudonocardia sp. TaxID=60912 RepID=UPI002CA5BD87|nr:ATP-binding protein [Pseudonocardia sp.]HTF50861.1 ATP-binding protein [Pseudonocardia sp.]